MIVRRHGRDPSLLKELMYFSARPCQRREVFGEEIGRRVDDDTPEADAPRSLRLAPRRITPA